MSRIRTWVRSLRPVARWRRNHIIRIVADEASKRGLSVVLSEGHLVITQGDESICIDARHYLYAFDISADFGYYFGAVAATEVAGRRSVDYSTTKLQRYTGFDDYAVLTPSLAEPLETTTHYAQLAGDALSPGANILDLGAYSGLSAIIFQRLVGSDGRVVAVEADPTNAFCAEVNFQSELLARGAAPTLEKCAIWSSDTEIAFSAESSMGGAAVAYVGATRGSVISVRALCLSSLAQKHSLERIDLIKMDIEGAEREALSDSQFFRTFRPTVILEAHSEQAARESERSLSSLGYTVQRLAQPGTELHLLLAQPQPMEGE